MPGRAVALVFSLHAVATVLTVTAFVDFDRPTHEQLAYAGVVTFGIVLSRTWAAIRRAQSENAYAHDEHIQHIADDGWLVAAALGLSLTSVVATAMLSNIAGTAVHRIAARHSPTRWTAPAKPSRALFNASANLVAVVAAQQMFVRAAGGESTGLDIAAAAVAAILVMQLVQDMLNAAVVHMSAGIPWRRLLMGEVNIAVAQCSQKCLGVLIWAAWQLAPWTVVFAFPLLLSFERAQRHAALLEQARTDGKTGLANASHWKSQAESTLERLTTGGAPVAVAIVDLDHFKRVNDTYGHVVGDEVLRETAARLTLAVRPADLVGRFGGEEFTVLMARATLDEALIVAERLRSAMEASRITCLTDSGTAEIAITCSIGICVVEPGDGAVLSDVLARADAALYAAKQGGRNRVEAARPWPPVADLPATFDDRAAR